MRRYISTFRRIFPGVHYVFASIILLLGVFTLIYAVGVDQGFFLRSVVTDLDRSTLEMILEQRGDTRSGFFLFFTYLGNWEIITSIALVALAVMVLARKTRAALFFTAILVVGQLSSLFFKQLLSRSRPDNAHALIEQGGYSFPSGHALGSFIFYGALAYLSATLLKKHWQHVLVIVGGACLIGLIGISRLYLGVHWLSDVVAGWIMGGTLLIVFAVFFEHRKAIFPVAHREAFVSKLMLLAVAIALAAGEALFIVWYYLSHPLP